MAKTAMIAETESSLIPLDFHWRTLEDAVMDHDYLKERIAQEAERVIPLLYASEGISPWERITAYAQALCEFSPLEDDFCLMGFIFRSRGGVCTNMLFQSDRAFDKKYYKSEGDEETIYVQSEYIAQHRAELSGKISNRREGILEIFNTANRLLFEKFFQKLRDQLGIKYEVQEKNKVLIAHQVIPELPDPLYRLIERRADSTQLLVKVQKYRPNEKMYQSRERDVQRV